MVQGPQHNPGAFPSGDPQREFDRDLETLHAFQQLFSSSAAIAQEIFSQTELLNRQPELLEIAGVLYREAELFGLNLTATGLSGEALATNLFEQTPWSASARERLLAEGDAEGLGKQLAQEWQRGLALARRGMPVSATNPESQGPIKIIPFFLMPSRSPLLEKLSDDERQLLTRFYGPVGPQRIVLRVPAEVLAASGQAEELRNLVLKLAGQTGDISELLERFDGAPPIVLGRMQMNWSADEVALYAHHINYRVPYGSLAISRQYLESQQARIERGEIRKYTVEIEGRVDPEFLAWACGRGKGDSGVIPDVELLYTLPLPDGGKYTFVLKAARRYTQRTPNNASTWSQGDAMIAPLLGEYFADAVHRRTWAIFADPRIEQYPAETHKLMAEPFAVSTLSDYQMFCRTWRNYVYQTLTDSEGGPRATYRKIPWMDPEYADAVYFSKVLRERIDSLPHDQNFFPPEYLMLTNEEKAAFLHVYERKLFEICQAERERVAREFSDGTHQRRVAKGYVGPPEGFPLPLDYMIMDMIVDERRYQEYRREHARRKGIAPEDVKVPLQLGRSFWHPEWFLNSDALVADLHEHPPERTIEIKLRDPLSATGIIEYPAHKIESLDDYLQDTNIERLSSAAASIVVLSVNKKGEGPRQFHVDAFRAAEREMRRRVDEVRFRYDEQVHQRALALERLVTELKELELGRAEYRRRIIARRDEMDKPIEALHQELREARGELLEFYATQWPGGFQRFAVQLHSIVDRQSSDYIFSIGAGESPVFAPAHHGFKRTHSESLGGRNMYAGGEVTIGYYEATFKSFEAWKRFDRQRRSSPPPTELHFQRATDGSGHYEPLPVTLQYAVPVLSELFRARGINCDDISLEDGIAPTMRMRGLTYDFGR